MSPKSVMKMWVHDLEATSAVIKIMSFPSNNSSCSFFFNNVEVVFKASPVFIVFTQTQTETQVVKHLTAFTICISVSRCINRIIMMRGLMWQQE